MSYPLLTPLRPDPATEILDYLRDRLPGYPFDLAIDADFVDELLDDFPHADTLEEIKTFRWYHDNEPTAHVANIRLAIRRWIAKRWPRARP